MCHISQCLILHKTRHKGGRQHDYHLYKHNRPVTPSQVENIVNLGYLGIEKDFPPERSTHHSIGGLFRTFSLAGIFLFCFSFKYTPSTRDLLDRDYPLMKCMERVLASGHPHIWCPPYTHTPSPFFAQESVLSVVKYS